jgi:poly(A) polymerase
MSETETETDTDTEAAAPKILPRPEHTVSRKLISDNALKVLYRLNTKGYKAYLVGGSVRDMMVGIRPKDFDVGTDARPHDVKKLFRNSRIIGRRFRLVHVFFGPEIVEVSTFRRDPDPRHQDSDDDELLITSDNTYGNPRQDAFRRDFTINGLFYDISDFSVVDYVGGTDDLAQKLVRTIGDPDLRMQEDPVRMMRACEFAGRLGFTIDRDTQRAIQRHRRQLELAAPARVTEEVLDLMRCGAAASSLEWMLDLGLLEVLLPEAYAMVGTTSRDLEGFGRLLPALDRMVRDGAGFTDAALLGLLLLPKVLARREDVEALEGRPLSRAELRRLVEEIAESFSRRFQLSRNRAAQTLHALTGFLRLCEPSWTPRRRLQFTHRPYFEDARQLFAVMVEATGEGREALAAWEEAALAGGRSVDDGDDAESRPVRAGRSGGRRRKRRRGRRGGRGA